MEKDFWQQKWATNEIGFHESKPNPFLVAHFDKLSLGKGSHVFLPLCGKTLDIGWLLTSGIKVSGAELSETAIEQLFAELGIEPTILRASRLTRYSAPNIDIFVGDIFDLSKQLLGPVDAIYDRAALVALPDQMRKRYTQHLLEITGSAEQLLITFEYDQSAMDGPPFSIGSTEVNRHYTGCYTITLLESMPVAGKLKGTCDATEHVWLLQTSN